MLIRTAQGKHTRSPQCQHFRYFTVTLGADPSYETQEFYRPRLTDDSHRVNAMFSKAGAMGLHVEKRSLDKGELRRLVLRADCLVVTLVDGRYLQYNGIVSSHVSTGGYVGHYVIICGWNEATDEYLLSDPACPGECYLDAAILETARKSYGTDEDLLVIQTNSNGC